MNMNQLRTPVIDIQRVPAARGSSGEASATVQAAQSVVLKNVATSSGEVLELIMLIHPFRLLGDCLTYVLTTRMNCRVDEFSNATDAIVKGSFPDISILVYSLGCEPTSREIGDLDTLLHKVDGRVPVVVIGQSEDPLLIRDLLASGVRGYIPLNHGLEVMLHALLLVKAGGIFAPASCLMNLNRTPVPKSEDAGELDMLTAKQLAVVKAIRQGKPNKTIAYELNMCESTVKVHVRNIMKKLRATNRTQVAYIANQCLEEHQAARLV
jgi:DNA-binding NarL/FixJ family response regulator